MIPEELNIKLKDAIKKSPELNAEYQKDPQITSVLDFAMAIEGLAKSAGTHAAGVVIGDKPLTEYVPLQKLAGKTDILTQWTDVEKAGLLKMDFLGLRNLTILDKAVQAVKKHRGVDIVPKDLPLDDKETFELLQRGETKGIFQLESGGMRDLLTKMKPDQFADIIATSALYRPGPLEGGMVMTYVNCKHGREPIPKVHPIVDEVLAETYGVMVYQEQVMRILNRLGGIELASAYKCIKAISKKKLSEIAKYREDFLAGAEKNGMTRERADELFGLIEKFAGYGFNKSHSTAYGAIAYQTAYLKAHYPGEFMAALLSCGMDSTERISEHSDDARRMGLLVLPPDINRSDVEFSVIDEKEPEPVAAKPSKNGKRAKADEAPRQEVRGRIAFGLGAIRGVGAACMQAILDERRANGPFKNIFDLAERVDPKILTKGNLEILVKAGALDGFADQGSRAQHFEAVDRAIQSATSKLRDKAKGQKSLFGGGESASPSSPDSSGDLSLPPAEEWPHGQKLAYEKDVLGFYMTSHPLTEFADQLAQFTSQKVNQLRDLPDGKELLIGGMISSVKLATTKQPSRNSNSRYANFDLEDATGIVRCIIWPDDYARQAELIKPESVILVKGRTDSRGREPNVIVNKIFTIADAEKEFTKQVVVKFRRGYHTEQDMKRARDALARFPGKTPVILFVDTWEEPKTNGAASDLETSHSDSNGNGAGRTPLRCILSTPLSVTCSSDLRLELTNSLGPDGFRFLSFGNDGG
jgi:DNA polymerase-3 subunit alpha